MNFILAKSYLFIMLMTVYCLQRVALLEFPTSYEVDYDVESFIDHHRQMRLDIDNMSYEVSI